MSWVLDGDVDAGFEVIQQAELTVDRRPCDRAAKRPVARVRHLDARPLLRLIHRPMPQQHFAERVLARDAGGDHEVRSRVRRIDRDMLDPRRIFERRLARVCLIRRRGSAILRE